MNYFNGAIVALLLLGACFSNMHAAEDKVDASKEFDKQFAEAVAIWKKGHEKPSFYSTHEKHDGYKEIMACGVKALPKLMEMLKKGDICDDPMMFLYILGRLSGKYFEFNEGASFKDKFKKYIDWWENDRGKTRQFFDSLYNDNAMDQNDKIRRIIRLGADAIPFMIEKIKEGDATLIDAISIITSAVSH